MGLNLSLDISVGVDSDDVFTRPERLHFERCSIDDCISVRHLMQVLSHGSPSPSDAQIRDTTEQAFVAVIRLRKTGEIVAMASLHAAWTFAGKQGLVHEVAVDEGYQRHGLAKLLMEFLEKEARRWNFSHIDLTSSRPGAQALYDKIGYERRSTTCFRKKL